MIAFIVKATPRSVNARSCQIYKNKLVSEFERNNFSGVPFEGILYARIYYFYSVKCFIDVDNLSKPAIDAFKGKAYLDDCALAFRASAKIDLRETNITEFDCTKIPENVFQDMLDVWDVIENFLYIEIGFFANDMIIFGR